VVAIAIYLDGDGRDEVIVRHLEDRLQEHLTRLSVLRATTGALEGVGDVMVEYRKQADAPDPELTCRSTVTIAKGTITVKMKRSSDLAAECPMTGVHRFALVKGKLVEMK
jgi:hypothetical protein